MAQAFVSLFIIIDPIGNILVFHLYSAHFERRDRLTAATVDVLAAFIMLATFSAGGQEALDFLGISNASFSVAAGLLLLPPAYRLVMEGEPTPSNADHSRSPLDFALVPLATPLIAGPGALASTASFAGSEGTLETIGAVALVLAITFVAFSTAGTIFRLLGEPFLRLASRIVGIILFAIAVDFVLDGLQVVFNTSS
jgi:multiple antibiotic resistance protein